MHMALLRLRFDAAVVLNAQRRNHSRNNYMCISNIQAVCTTLLKNMDADYTEKMIKPK